MGNLQDNNYTYYYIKSLFQLNIRNLTDDNYF